MTQLEDDKKEQEMLLDLIGTEKDNDGLRVRIVKLEQSISLFEAGFKCKHKHCRSTEELQWHHLILRNSRNKSNDVKRFKIRHQWSNVIVICKKCHCIKHKKVYQRGNTGCITENTIKRIKKRYGVN